MLPVTEPNITFFKFSNETIIKQYIGSRAMNTYYFVMKKDYLPQGGRFY